jgi:polysaccharide export outer membrane protein
MITVTSRKYLPAVWLSLFLAASVAAFAQETPTAPPAVPDVSQQNQSNQQQQPATPAPNPRSPTGGEPVNSSSYKIGAADVLNVHVWNEEKFSGPATVHQDGMFTMPLLGDLKAGGMTPVQVEGEVTKALAKYVRQPLVTITVQQVGSKKYYMDGQIARPGEFPLVVPTTILEAISKAGGLLPFGNAKKIYVLRGSNRIKFNYKDVLHGKHMEQNIQLESGDHVVVP